MVGEEKAFFSWRNAVLYHWTPQKAQELNLNPPQTGGHWQYEVTKSAHPPLSRQIDVHGGRRATSLWNQFWRENISEKDTREKGPEKDKLQPAVFRWCHSNDGIIEKLAGGERECMMTHTLNFSEISKQMANHYGFEFFVSGHLIFTYESYVERGGDEKIKFLSWDGIIEDHWIKGNRLLRRREITLDDLDLWVEIKKCDEGEQDISCGSKFMLGIMDELGNSTQSTYRSIRVVEKEIIYLVMDNTGGNRENKTMLEYSEYLSDNYNILVHHQVPRSPKTNMLDLSAWMTVQSKVQKYHRRNVKFQDALARSVKKAWQNVEEYKLTRILEWFLKVLDIIIQYQGENNLIESNRVLKGVLETM